MRQKDRSPLPLVVGLCVLAVAGCASSRNGPFLGQKFDDPPGLSPYNQPLSSGGPQVTPYRGVYPDQQITQSPPLQNRSLPNGVGRSSDGPAPTPATEGDGNGPIELGRPIPADGPDGLEVPRTYREPLPGDSESDAGETIHQRVTPDSLAAPAPLEHSTRPPAAADGMSDPSRAPLELVVNDPQRALLMEAASFEVVIRNPYSEPVDNVVITCRFDEGLSFPEIPDRALRQRLGTLGALESRTLDLALTTEVVGRHCVEFTLTGDGREQAYLKRCVDVVDLQASVSTRANGNVEIELVGPSSRNAGGRLECVLTIENRTGNDASGIVATIHHDAALIPKEASTGAVKVPGALIWDLGLLRVDERVQIQVEFDCPTPSEHACIDAEVVGRSLPTQQQELCAVIKPRPTLDVAIIDVRDPVPVGETTTYVVVITNRGLEPLADVRVDAEISGGLEFLFDGEDDESAASRRQSQTTLQTATYAIGGPIAVEDSRTVRVDVRGTAAGKGGLRVLATESATDRRVMVEEPTIINPRLLDLPLLDDVAGYP